MNRATWLGVSALLLGGVGQANAGFINGGFDTGYLTGWTMFTTPNGNNGSGLPNVESFDTTGSGASLAAHFQVGANTFVPGTPDGGGIYQTLNLAAGTYRVTADIAAIVNTRNGDFGSFSVYVDDKLYDTTNLTPVSFSGTARGALDATFVISTPGVHNIGFKVTRDYVNDSSTPEQYIDNATLGFPVSPVPGPSSLALLATGILTLSGYFGWRRRKQATTS
jgi:hypothetical protein